MNVVVCCKDPDRSEALLRWLPWLSLTPDSAVTLLTVLGRHDPLPSVELPIPPGFPLTLTRRLRHGSAAVEILAEVSEAGADLVVCGWRTHRTTLGSTAERLFRACPANLLLVRPADVPLEGALICTGGESPSLDTLHSAASLLNREQIRVGILHVMSQVAFSDASPHEDLLDSAESAVARGTHEGLHLRRAAAVFQEAGFRGEVVPILRHGLVVDEVVAELRQGKYELLVIGSRQPRTKRRWSDLLLEDVGADLASRAHCSVLLIRPAEG